MFGKNYNTLARNFCSNRTPDSCYDAIVVGGGHNGLVAAAYLAKNGVKTCVLEKRSVLGGAAVTEEIIPNFKFSRASYLLSLLRPQVYNDLQLKKFGLEYFVRNPSSYTPLRKSHWHSNEVKSLTLGMEKRFNFEQISKFSERDAKQYITFHEKLQNFIDCIQSIMDVSPHTLKQLTNSENSVWNKLKIITESKSVRELLKGSFGLTRNIPFAYEMIFSPAVDIMNKWFETDSLKATILTDACIGSFQSPNTVGSSYILFHHVMGGIDDYKGAWVYPKGGMGAVSDAIAKCALHHGAHIFTNQCISEIKLNDRNQVTGVLTTDQKYLKSSVILSNATPKVTFLDLLPDDALPITFKTRIENINYKSPVTKLNVALRNIPNFEADPNMAFRRTMPHHQCTIHLNCESMGDILKAYADGFAGLLPQKPMIEITIPSSLDPTLCPEGKHVCLMFTQYTPYNLRNGRTWDEETKKEFADLVFNSVEEYALGFREDIIDYELLSPPDLEREFSLTGGNIYHGELSLNQLFFNRPTNWYELSPYTPIAGLFLCGSGAHPGGGVTGAPGRLAALSVLSEIRK